MKTVLKVALGIILGLVVVIVGCSALISAGLDEADKKQAKKGITLREFRSVKQGTRQRAIERRFGKPESSQEFEQEIAQLQDQPSRSSCIYYPEKGQPLFEGRSFQFCFDERRLTGKNAY